MKSTGNDLAIRARVIIVEMQRHISPLKDLKSLWKMIKVFRREQPQMVHSMTPKAGMICMLAGWLTRVPVRVHTFTGLLFPTSIGLKRKILMATDWLTCACATHILPEGEGVKRDILENRITKKSLKVLGYGNCKGIDLIRFDCTPEVIAEANKLRKTGAFSFIAIGRLVGDKGINELVEAFCCLNRW
ncbi:MAG: glycosyltransferase [Muribaculaceae bacterium]|nr:glycosyltransferase [Muribaculaceae bacterium]